MVIDPAIAARVREDFSKQRFMTTLGARIARVDAGLVEIELPFRDDLTQQHGFLHAGAVASVMDSAGGYAALSLWPLGSEVLSVEFKVNLLEPAVGERLVARGRVVRSGGRISACTMEAEAIRGEERALVATGLQTLVRKAPRQGQADATP